MVVRFILDRCASTVILYIGVLALLKLYGSFLPQYLFLAIFGLSTVKVIHSVFEATRKELQVSALGGRAPRIRTWSPSNIGFIVKALSYFRRHENMELWQEQFKWAGQQLGKDMHYTAEAVVLGKRLILTADPQVIKALLHNLDDFGKGAHFHQQFESFLGDGIFNSDGAQWQSSRSLLRPQFTKDRLSDIKVFEEHVQELLPLLKGAYPGATVRVDDLFFRYTLDAAGHFLMGAQIDSLKNADAEFATAFAAVQHTQAIIARAGSLDWAVPRGDFNAGLKYLNSFVERFIDKALALSPAELAATGKDTEGYTFLHGLAVHTRDRKEIRDALVNILLAGRDTTACTLAWLFYELSRKPEIVVKLREDIDRHIGLDPSNIPTYDQLKSCRYLQHCITQTLMLHPIVPYNVRVAMRDMTLVTRLEDGTEQTLGILEGTQVGYSTLIMQNREDLFPAPTEKTPPYHEFAPERFEHWRPHPAQYIPFNAGPRICIGQSFAQTELQYTIVRIFQHFKSVENRTHGFPGRQADIVLQPSRPVELIFRS